MKKLYLVMLVMFFVCSIVSTSVFAVTANYNSVNTGNATASSIANTIASNNINTAINTIGGNTISSNVVGETNTATENALTTDTPINTMAPETVQNTLDTPLTTEPATNDVSTSVGTVTNANSSTGLGASDIINILLIVIGVVIVLLGIAVIIRLKQ